MYKPIIFSDLDGTLLDAKSYSFENALPALNLIQKRGVPLILCSSKTRAEIEVHRRQFNNNHPFISENGGGIFIPDDYFSEPFDAIKIKDYSLIALGISYGEIRNHFITIRDRLGAKVRGFGDMTLEKIMEITGLGYENAMLAKQRDFDEPFIFENLPEQRFLQEIKDSGLNWTRGRIFHIMGNHDKGRAVEILMNLYKKEYPDIVTIGLGDGLNDLPMLETVDCPVFVQNDKGSFDFPINNPNAKKTKNPGPLGWNETLLNILSGENMSKLKTRSILTKIYQAAIKAADPFDVALNYAKLENQFLHIGDTSFNLDNFTRILVVGAGKAASKMALAVEAILDNRISTGLVIVKEGQSAKLARVMQIEATHPIPNEAGLNGTQKILEMVQDSDDKTLILCLLSGGASSLLVAPATGLTLQAKSETTALLMKSGADIFELNVVRKHLSGVKGGKLAEAAFPAQVATLILSDVIRDPLDVIASGPTAPDHSSFADAWSVITKYGLNDKIPLNVKNFLERGLAGLEPETLKYGSPFLKHCRNFVIGGINLSLAAAEKKARELGISAEIITSQLRGEARDAAQFLAGKAITVQSKLQPGEKRCLVSGGETTVTVKGKGKGGRNQELALAFALAIQEQLGISLLSAGTDGIDGNTNAAGAIVDNLTIRHAKQYGLEPSALLDSNDSWGFFNAFDALSNSRSHFITGPTGTNVMDLQIILIENKAPEENRANKQKSASQGYSLP